MKYKILIGLLLVAVLLVSGCAGQQAQSSQTLTQALAQSSVFPDGWETINKTEQLQPVGNARISYTRYNRGELQLQVITSVFRSSLEAKTFYETALKSTVTPETFSAGEGAFVGYSTPNRINYLGGAGHKGDIVHQVYYTNTPDGTYKPRDPRSEKELVRNVVRALLS